MYVCAIQVQVPGTVQYFKIKTKTKSKNVEISDTDTSRLLWPSATAVTAPTWISVLKVINGSLGLKWTADSRIFFYDDTAQNCSYYIASGPALSSILGPLRGKGGGPD